MSMMIVKGYIENNDIEGCIKSVLQNGLQDYFPDNKLLNDLDRLVRDIYCVLNADFNLPIGLVVKHLGKFIDCYINNFYDFYISDIGMIIADRIVKGLTVMNLVEKQKRG